MDESKPARLFLALWPDAGSVRELEACSDSLPWPLTARRVAAARLHLTLHFIGGVERSRLPEIADGLAAGAAPIGLTLDRIEVWKSGIAVLLPSGTPPGLAELYAALGARLGRLGLGTGDRPPYRPHVTLARKAGGLVAGSVQRLQWRSTGHALMESRGGYFTVRRYG